MNGVFFHQVKMAYFHLQLAEKEKQASANIDSLSIAASSFFNLEQVNKWVSDQPAGATKQCLSSFHYCTPLFVTPLSLLPSRFPSFPPSPPASYLSLFSLLASPPSLPLPLPHLALPSLPSLHPSTSPLSLPLPFHCLIFPPPPPSLSPSTASSSPTLSPLLPPSFLPTSSDPTAVLNAAHNDWTPGQASNGC